MKGDDDLCNEAGASFSLNLNLMERKMLTLNLDLPGRATEDTQLVAVAETLEATCIEWESEKEEMLAETNVVNRHKIAEQIARNIELAECLATVLREAADRYSKGEWATAENVVVVQAS